MKIKTTDKCKTVDGAKVKPGDIVETDANTARNLIKKGFAEPHDAESKALDLDEKSVLSAAAAQEQIAEAVAEKEAKKGHK
jgi:hypothetical protein